MTPTPPLPPEDADMAAVREALTWGEGEGYVEIDAAYAALDRLDKRVQEAERERDAFAEAMHKASLSVMRRRSLAAADPGATE